MKRWITTAVAVLLLSACGGPPPEHPSAPQGSEGDTIYVEEDVRRHPTSTYHGYWIEIETDEVYCIYARDDGSDLECFPWSELQAEEAS